MKGELSDYEVRKLIKACENGRLETTKDLIKDLSFLALSMSGVTDKEATSLAGALEENKSLIFLDLSVNQIGVKGATALAETIKVNKALISLGLEDNQIWDKGTEALAQALKENKTLSSLDLSVNQIGVEGATALSETIKVNKTLTSLDLSFNKIGVEGGKYLAEALKAGSFLTSLNLGDNQIGDNGTKALAQALKAGSILTSLGLSRNKLRDEGTKALARALEENKTLTSLDLRHNEIGDEGARALARALEENKTLTSLNLQDNQIGDKGSKALVEALEENKALTSLILWDNQIGDEGVKALARALKENSTLISLNLQDNQIGDKGAKALARALEENKTLTSLVLWDNQIGDEGAKALAQALKENITLTECDLDIKVPTIEACLERNGKIAKYIKWIVDFVTNDTNLENIPIVHNDLDYNTTAFWQEGAHIKQMQQKVARKLAATLCATDAKIDTLKLKALQSNNQVVEDLQNYTYSANQKLQKLCTDHITKVLNYKIDYTEHDKKIIDQLRGLMSGNELDLVKLLDDHKLMVNIGLHQINEFRELLASDEVTTYYMFSKTYTHRIKVPNSSNNKARLVEVEIEPYEIVIGAQDVFSHDNYASLGRNLAFKQDRDKLDTHTLYEQILVEEYLASLSEFSSGISNVLEQSVSYSFSEPFYQDYITPEAQEILGQAF